MTTTQARPSEEVAPRPPLRKFLNVALLPFAVLVALFATLFSALRGPHLSNLEFWLFSFGFAAFIVAIFFGLIFYFWGHPAFQRRK